MDYCLNEAASPLKFSASSSNSYQQVNLSNIGERFPGAHKERIVFSISKYWRGVGKVSKGYPGRTFQPSSHQTTLPDISSFGYQREPDDSASLE